MLLSFLACTHTPPQLYPRPIPRPVIAEVAERPPQPGDLPRVHAVESGAPPEPGRYVATPPGVALRAADWRRRAESLEDAADTCYAGRELDRVLAQDAYTRLYADYARAHSEAQGLRVAVPVAALLGGLLGAGLAVGVAWAYPR